MYRFLNTASVRYLTIGYSTQNVANEIRYELNDAIILLISTIKKKTNKTDVLCIDTSPKDSILEVLTNVGKRKRHRKDGTDIQHVQF